MPQKLLRIQVFLCYEKLFEFLLHFFLFFIHVLDSLIRQELSDMLLDLLQHQGFVSNPLVSKIRNPNPSRSTLLHIHFYHPHSQSLFFLRISFLIMTIYEQKNGCIYIYIFLHPIFFQFVKMVEQLEKIFKEMFESGNLGP